MDGRQDKEAQGPNPEPKSEDRSKEGKLGCVMNDNASFDMKTKGNSAPNGGEGVKRQFKKERAHAFPKMAFAARPLPGGLKEVASKLLSLVNGKSKHHQEGKDDREMFFSVPKVVLEMIALIFEGVEGLILDFPTCPSAPAQGVDVVLVNGEVGDPTEMAGGVAVDFPVFEEIDPQMGIRFVQGDIVEKAKAMGDTLTGELKLSRAPLGLSLRHIVEQIAVVARFDTQDKAQLVALQLLDVGSIRTQGIFDHNQGQMGMILA